MILLTLYLRWEEILLRTNHLTLLQCLVIWDPDLFLDIHKYPLTKFTYLVYSFSELTTHILRYLLRHIHVLSFTILWCFSINPRSDMSSRILFRLNRKIFIKIPNPTHLAPRVTNWVPQSCLTLLKFRTKTHWYPFSQEILYSDWDWGSVRLIHLKYFFMNRESHLGPRVIWKTFCISNNHSS